MIIQNKLEIGQTITIVNESLFENCVNYYIDLFCLGTLIVLDDSSHTCYN